MSDWWELYRALFRYKLALLLQYRAALAVWLVAMLLLPGLYLLVWSSVGRARGEPVGGFTPELFVAYFVAVAVVQQLTSTWIFLQFEDRVRKGLLSAQLLKPLHPVHDDLADLLAQKAAALALLAPLLAVLWFCFPAFRATQGWASILIGPALLLALGLSFAAGWLVALAAFWTTRVGAVNSCYLASLVFLSGQMTPLELLPRPVFGLAAFLPFRWMVAFPVELLLGRLEMAEALGGLASQAAWLAALGGLATWAWRQGLRRYSAVGA